MIEIEIDGMEEIQDALDRITRVAAGNWSVAMTALGAELVRYATSISPVITGSYAGSHRSTVIFKGVELSIDPSARNIISRTRVIDYADSVENRHSVYARTFGQLPRLAVAAEDVIFEEMGL